MHDPDPILDALDPDQRAVAECVQGPLVVIAGAGTGKTRAITHRIAHAARTGAADPRATLAVTFTTRAAGEMRARLAQLGVEGVQARTFHSAALKQVQYFWPRAYGVELPPVSESRHSLVAEAASRQRLAPETALVRDLGQEVTWAKVSNVTAGEYPALARASGREVSGVEAEVVARVLTEYESVKRLRGVIDFEDILLCTVALLHEHPEVAAQVRERYRHFTVDEYQDVSALQESVLQAWLGDRDDVCVVGDPAQSIHAYAGARPDFLTGFAARHPGARTVRLVRDYRSTPEVVALANRVLGSDTPLVGQRASGPAPVFEGHTTPTEEARAIVAWLQGRAAAGTPWREMAVLFRTNAQSPAIEAALAEAGVPYRVRGSDRFYERPEIRRALRLLAAHAQLRPDDPGAAGVRAVLEGAGWAPEEPGGAGRSREEWESLAALVDLADEVTAEAPEATLADVVAELDERAQRREAPQGQGVTLSTLHAAKGLEWDAVALAGIAEGSVPFVLATTPQALAEERRLLHVGITRAREHLRLSWARTGGPGHFARPMSRFLAGLTPGTTRSAPPRAPRPTGTALTQRCRGCGGSLGSAAERKLGRHEACRPAADETLVQALTAWRAGVAGDGPAFLVLTDATLTAVAERRPRTVGELAAIPGVGQARAHRHARQLLALLAQHPPTPTA